MLPRSNHSVMLLLAAVLAAAVVLSDCGSNAGSSSMSSGASSASGGSGSSASTGTSGGTTPPPPPLGGFAAGIGAAGQTSSANFLIGTIVPFDPPVPTKINSDGTLTGAKVAPPAGSWHQAMSLSGAINPSGTYFYEAAAPGIYGYIIDRQTGDLTLLSSFPVATSQNFDAIAIDQLGKFVYAYGGGQIFGYTIQSGTGLLSPVAGSPFAATPSGQQQYFQPGNRLAVSQDNKHLYVAGSTGIMGFSIDNTTGALTPVAGSPFGASSGAALSLTAPSTGFLYETVPASSLPATTGIFGYSIDKSTGALTPLPGSPFGPGCAAPNLTSPANGKLLFGGRCGMYMV
ncbi:MAG: hypothetical protein JO356_07395, partial [Acidobacteria bacterium]|nr:hypothetical protein [Acidobacteriota bacterium]